MKKGDRISGINQADVLIEGEIVWVIGDEYSLRSLDGHGYHIYKEGELADFKVTFESAPSYQSTVAGMSDEALRASIEGLRLARSRISSPIKGKRERTPKGDPMKELLASLPEEERAKLKEKLGLT